MTHITFVKEEGKRFKLDNFDPEEFGSMFQVVYGIYGADCIFKVAPDGQVYFLQTQAVFEFFETESTQPIADCYTPVGYESIKTLVTHTDTVELKVVKDMVAYNVELYMEKGKIKECSKIEPNYVAVFFSKPGGEKKPLILKKNYTRKQAIRRNGLIQRLCKKFPKYNFFVNVPQINGN
jgi:hypothetical protein